MKGDLRTSKKGFAMTELPKIVLIFVVIVVMIAIGSLIVNELRDSFDQSDNYTAGYNATLAGEDAFNTFASYLPLLALVLIFAVIISVVVVALLPRVMQ